MSVKSAIQEAKRCLRCDICINCGQCVDICRNQMGVDAIHLSYVEKNPTAETDFGRPGKYCIGCGSCAIKCPTTAITMQDKDGTRTLRMCGVEMSRHQLVTCTSCGQAYVPEKQMEFVEKHLTSNNKVKYSGNLCSVCARKNGAKNLVGDFFVY